MGYLFQSHVAALWKHPRAQVRARGSCRCRTALLTFLFANGGLGWELWAALHGSFPWFAYCRSRHDKGKAAGAVWEHLICAPDFNTSMKHWLPSPGFSLCCLEGLENADWAGLEGCELGLWFSNWRCILPGAVQAPIGDSVLDGSLRNGF